MNLLIYHIPLQGGFPKWGYPQIIHLNRRFHHRSIHHWFWGSQKLKPQKSHDIRLKSQENHTTHLGRTSKKHRGHPAWSRPAHRTAHLLKPAMVAEHCGIRAGRGVEALGPQRVLPGKKRTTTSWFYEIQVGSVCQAMNKHTERYSSLASLEQFLGKHTTKMCVLRPRRRLEIASDC